MNKADNLQMRSQSRMPLLTLLALALCVVMQGDRVTAAMFGLDDLSWKLVENYNIQNYILDILGIPLAVLVIGVVIFASLAGTTGIVWLRKVKLETLVIQLQQKIESRTGENLKLEEDSNNKDIRIRELEKFRRKSDELISQTCELGVKTAENLRERLEEIDKLKIELATLKFDLKDHHDLKEYKAKLTTQKEELMAENGEMRLKIQHLEFKLTGKNALLKNEIGSKKHAETQMLRLLDELNGLKQEMAFKHLNTDMYKKYDSAESFLTGEFLASQQVVSILEREIEKSNFNQKQLKGMIRQNLIGDTFAEITVELKGENERLEHVNNGLRNALSQSEVLLQNEMENRKYTEGEILRLSNENERLNLATMKYIDESSIQDLRLRQEADEERIQADIYNQQFQEMKRLYEELKSTFRIERKTLKLAARNALDKQFGLEKKLNECEEKLDDYKKENLRILKIAGQEREQAEMFNRQVKEMKKLHEESKSSFDKERKCLEVKLQKLKWDAKNKSDKHAIEKANLLKSVDNEKTQADMYKRYFNEIRKHNEDQKLSFQTDRQALIAKVKSIYNQNCMFENKLDTAQSEIQQLYDQIYNLRYETGRRDLKDYPLIPPMLVKPPLPEHPKTLSFEDSGDSDSEVYTCPPPWAEEFDFGPPFLPRSSARVSASSAAKLAAHSKADIMASYLIGPRAQVERKITHNNDISTNFYDTLDCN